MIPLEHDHKQKNIEIMFEFAFMYLIDEGPLNSFVPKKKDVGDNIWTFVAFYDFVLAKDW